MTRPVWLLAILLSLTAAPVLACPGEKATDGQQQSTPVPPKTP